MQNPTRRAVTIGGLATGLAAGLSPITARSQAAWPAGQPVRMIVPFAAGGATDVIGRLISERLANRWGSPVIVENIGGAGANIGMERVAKGTSDGAQMLFTSPAVATNQFLYPKLGYDPENDLVPVSLSAVAPALILAKKSLEASTAAELIAYAKANPGKLTWGHNGPGTATHMTGELLKRMAGIEMTGLAYRSGGLAMNDLIAGNIDILVDNISSSLPQVRAGTVKCIGVTSAKVHAPAPDLVPMASAVPGYEATAWFGVMMRAGTPPAILAKVEADAREAARDAGLREKLLAIATDAVGSTAAEFAGHIAGERQRWGKLIKDLAIKAE